MGNKNKANFDDNYKLSDNYFKKFDFCKNKEKTEGKNYELNLDLNSDIFEQKESKYFIPKFELSQKTLDILKDLEDKKNKFSKNIMMKCDQNKGKISIIISFLFVFLLFFNKKFLFYLLSYY